MTNPSNTRVHEVVACLPGTCADVVATTGMHRNVAKRWLDKLHAAGKIHIGGWVRWQGGPMPVYRMGPGVDVRCKLKPLSPMARYNRFKQRAKATGAWEEREARKRAAETRRRARAAADRASFASDPLLHAFFGTRPTAAVT